jgi:ornithine carbamoyltransferase
VNKHSVAQEKQMAMSSIGTLKSVKRMPAPKTLPKIAASDFTRDLDISQDELLALLDLTQQVKSSPRTFAQALAGRYITLLFEKPSLRTRLTFELAAKQLGGDAVLSVGPIGDREPLKDVARNLDRWTNAIVARTFSQNTIDDLAYWSSVPVINALSDRFHPCQALADVFTLQERFGDVRGLKLAFVGDGNNVAHSLMLASLRLGMNFSLATPVGYEPDAELVGSCGRCAGRLHGRLGQHGPGK